MSASNLGRKRSRRCRLLLFIVHILTTDVHFLNKALFKDRNFMLSAIMFFAVGFVLLPTLALTSPMLEALLNYPVDTTGYLDAADAAAGAGADERRSGEGIDNWLFVIAGMISDLCQLVDAVHPRWIGAR